MYFEKGEDKIEGFFMALATMENFPPFLRKGKQ